MVISRYFQQGKILQEMAVLQLCVNSSSGSIQHPKSKRHQQESNLTDSQGKGCNQPVKKYGLNESAMHQHALRGALS